MSSPLALPWKYRQNSKELTPQRVGVLQRLSWFEREHSYPPSMRELADLLELRSPSTVHAHLESLERQGLVRRKPQTARRWTATRLGQKLSKDAQQAA
jgi:repressor LexA